MGPVWAPQGSEQGRKYQRRRRKYLALRHREDLKRALNVEQVHLGGGSCWKDWGKTRVRLVRQRKGKECLSICDPGKSLPLPSLVLTPGKSGGWARVLCRSDILGSAFISTHLILK